MASSTAFNCLSNSSLRDVAFFDFGSPGGGEFAGRFLFTGGSGFLARSDISGFRMPTGFLRLSFICFFSVALPFRASIALAIDISTPAGLLGGELPALLVELLESDESESLELDPELPDDDLEDFLRPLTLARAAATANLLRLLPN